MSRRDASAGMFARGAMNRQHEVVVRASLTDVSDWIARHLHHEGFDVVDDSFAYPGSWTAQYATIGNDRRAFWSDVLVDILPLRKQLSYSAAAYILRVEGQNVRVVMTAFESRPGTGSIALVAERVQNVAGALAAFSGDRLVSSRAKTVIEPTLNAKEFRRATRWDGRR